MHKTQVQVDQRPQHKTNYTEADIREVRNSLESLVQEMTSRTERQSWALKSTIKKWNFMKLKSFCKAKDTINRTK